MNRGMLGGSEPTVESVDRKRDHTPSDPHEARPGALRMTAFRVGDGLFLIGVSAVTAAVMCLAHAPRWNLALSLVVGMALAMAAQVLLAALVAPILGSIESTVPSMVAAMISPMAVCVADLAGNHPDFQESVAAGAAVGLGVFLATEAYGWRCRARFGRLTFGL